MKQESLRKLQQTPGTYPRPSTTCLWRKSFHICILGYLESVPGACWNFLRESVLLLLLQPSRCICWMYFGCGPPPRIPVTSRIIDASATNDSYFEVNQHFSKGWLLVPVPNNQEPTQYCPYDSGTKTSIIIWNPIIATKVRCKSFQQFLFQVWYGLYKFQVHSILYSYTCYVGPLPCSNPPKTFPISPQPPPKPEWLNNPKKTKKNRLSMAAKSAWCSLQRQHRFGGQETS